MMVIATTTNENRRKIICEFQIFELEEWGKTNATPLDLGGMTIFKD